MALVDVEPTTVQIPHEDGEFMELRKLSWKQLRNARKKAEAESREMIKDFGPEFMASITRGDDDDKASKRTRKMLEDRQYDASNYDTETLLIAGIAGWSYDGPVDETTVDMLDERTAVWAAQAIIDLVRPLDEEAEKNS